MAQNLHQLDPQVLNQLVLNNFQGKFDVKDLVSSVTEQLIAQSTADAGPFDPMPFIRTFELAVDRLVAVRKDLQTEGAESSVRAAERNYRERMVEINNSFESVTQSSSTMEYKINEVGRTAVRVGEQLENIHVSRQRAQAAYDLVDYYNQFSRGNTSKLDTLREEGGREGRAQTAVILRRLNAVTKEVDLPNAEATREAIDKYSETFEKDMLRLFDKCYRNLDIKLMAHCAQTLLDFNGGVSCVEMYVNQHEFFISQNRILELNTIEGNQLWETVSDPNTSAPKAEPGLTALFDDIRTVMKRESHIIQVVFPNPSSVMQVFLQRLFAQNIQQYIEQLLHKASKLSNLAFLRILHLCHQQASELVDYLKTFELTALARQTAADRFAASGSGPQTFGNILDSAMEELFSREISLYLERESQSLMELYSTFLSRFTKYHESTSKIKATGLLDRVINQLSTNSSSSVASPTPTNTKTTAALMKFSGILTGSSVTTTGVGISAGIEKYGEEPSTEMDGQLSIETAEKMLEWHAEAVGRCVQFVAAAEVPKQAFALLHTLSDAIGQSYVGAALGSTMARLDARDIKLEPSLGPLATLKTVDLICTLWQQYINIVLLPLATSSVTVRREMDTFNNQVIHRIELAVNSVVVRITEAVITWLGMQLDKQKKNDFKPKSDDLSLDRVDTELCRVCCEMLDKVRGAAFENLTGKNRYVFLTEIGVAFHGQLLEHFKKFPVSATGGLMLIKHIKSYQDAIAVFGISALAERFEFLRQLGNVFIVPPETLKMYTTENYLDRIDPTLLQPYLSQRTDWAQIESTFNSTTKAGGDTGNKLVTTGLV